MTDKVYNKTHGHGMAAQVWSEGWVFYYSMDKFGIVSSENYAMYSIAALSLFHAVHYQLKKFQTQLLGKKSFVPRKAA